jgi:hypothetical protein
MFLKRTSNAENSKASANQSKELIRRKGKNSERLNAAL